MNLMTAYIVSCKKSETKVPCPLEKKIIIILNKTSSLPGGDSCRQDMEIKKQHCSGLP